MARDAKNQGSVISQYKALQIIMVVAAAGFIGAAGYISLDYLAKPKVSTAHYHFNIQHYAGNEVAMYEVVNNTLLPILKMYERHPTWRANIEFQSLTLEYIDIHHVECAELLRKLVLDTKQIELILIQYSSTLALAYPYIDMYKSIAHTQELINDFFGVYPCDGISRAVLLQEGQFMLGSARILEDFKDANGDPLYDTFLATKESLTYFNLPAQAPMYTYQFPGREQIYVLPFAQVAEEAGVIHSVLWFTDGELVVAGEEEQWTDDGYWEMTAEYFQELEMRTINHERRLMDLENLGNQFLTLNDWIDTLITKNSAISLNKYIPEISWQSTKYGGSFMWMGNILGDSNYSDGEICSRNYRTHQTLLITETLLNYSHYNTTGVNASEYLQLSTQLKRAWLDLVEAEVTDTTGIRPEVYEGEYAINKTAYALSNASYIQSYVINATPELNTVINVNNESFQVVPENSRRGLSPVVTNQSNFINITTLSNSTTAPVNIETMNAISLNFSLMVLDTPWNANITNLSFYNVKVKFPNTTALEEKWAYVKFKEDFDHISYSPSLLERDHVTLTRDDYLPDDIDYYMDWDKFIDPNNCELYLPLSNGLIYSENSHIAIVKNNSQSHICVKWNNDEIRFMQTEIRNPAGEEWEYFVISDINITQAIEFANLINSYRPTTITAGNE